MNNHKNFSEIVYDTSKIMINETTLKEKITKYKIKNFLKIKNFIA